jgi:3-oxoacyl-[acyl-carrier protein] reductase
MRLVVTGGASGLGRSVAVEAAARGAQLMILDIDADRAEQVAKECRGKAFCCNLITDDVEAIIEQCTQQLGGLDGLVNSAGFGAGEAFLNMKASTWDRTFNLNVRALALATMTAGRIMVKQRSGRIVNVTSPASRMALPNYTAYAASKAAVDSLTRSAAVAMAPFGVRVNSVAPGMMDTPMQRETELAFAKLEGRDDMERFLQERTARIPIGRRIEPAEVAKAVIWLLFDAPDYLTAERLNMSGGLDKD